ncbi:MAG TPA: hypothetical protein PKH33_02935 [bacterium]|nr:hypothetical protein [bacterium]
MNAMNAAIEDCRYATMETPRALSARRDKIKDAAGQDKTSKGASEAAALPALPGNAAMDSADNSLVIPGAASRDNPSLRKSDDEIINGVPLV